MERIKEIIKNRIKNFCFKKYLKLENLGNCDFFTNGEAHFLNSLELNVVYDVGANVGNYSELVLQRNKNCEIHLFEPQKKCYNLFKNKFKNSNNVGCSDKEEEVVIYGCDNNTLSSVYKRDLKDFEEQEKIKLIRLDSYITQDIDLIKIDVEGHELKVLEGIGKYLNPKNIKMIQFEYGGCNLDSNTKLKDLYNILEKAGYKIYRIMPKGLKKINYTPSLDNFIYCNYLAK